MNNLPTIKVWDVDYSFILKNYLNPELWNKTWTLFQYKDMKVTLNIYSIYTKDEKIMFEIRTIYPSEDGKLYSAEEDVVCSLKIEDITFLKRQINSAIFASFVSVEKRRYIYTSKEYINLLEVQDNEECKLRKIAEEFLDKNNITSNNIRDAYIDAYVDEYSAMSYKMEDYISSKIYTEIPEMYLTFLSCLTNDPKTEIRTKEIQEKLTEKEFKKIMDEIEEFKEYMETDEYKDEMEENLKEV